MADIERLREAYAPWQDCIGKAITFLDAHVCGVRSLWIGDEEKNAIIATLLLPLLKECAADKGAFDGALAQNQDFSEAEYKDLLGRMGRLILRRYPSLTLWIMEAGKSLLGQERLLRGATYAELYAAHQKALEEIARFRTTKTFGQLAKDAKYDLAKELLAPLTRDPKVPLVENPRELRFMAEWEGRNVVIGRQWFGLLDVEFQPSKDNDRWMLVCVRPGERTADGVFYVYPDDSRDLGALLFPQTIAIAGVISDFRDAGVRLSPAAFVNPGDVAFFEPTYEAS